MSLKPKEFSLPFIQPHKVSNNVSLPRITGKPSYHGHHHSHYSSGLSSGLPPPLPHTTVKAPTHLSTFPPILLQSEFPSGKVSVVGDTILHVYMVIILHRTLEPDNYPTTVEPLIMGPLIMGPLIMGPLSNENLPTMKNI